jgi:hypothetical protein
LGCVWTLEQRVVFELSNQILYQGVEWC